MKADGHVIVAAVMLAIFAAMTAAAATFAHSAGLVPLMVGVPGLLLSAWQLLSEVSRARSGREPTLRVVGQREAHDAGIGTFPRDIRELPASRRDELAMMIWLAAFAAAIVAAGFLAGGTLAVAALLRLRLGERTIVSAGGALLAFLILHFVFERMLGLVLFEGLLFGA